MDSACSARSISISIYPSIYLYRKVVWDVLNKWVFWCVAARAHDAAAAAAAAAAGIAAPRALACADPLIPSRDDAATAEFLAKQLYALYCLPSKEESARLAHELLVEGTRAAAEVARVVCESVERWRLRLRGGRVQLSDATLGVSYEEDPEEPSSALLRWCGDGERSSGERSSGERSSGHVVRLFHG